MNDADDLLRIKAGIFNTIFTREPEYASDVIAWFFDDFVFNPDDHWNTCSYNYMEHTISLSTIERMDSKPYIEMPSEEWNDLVTYLNIYKQAFGDYNNVV